MTPAIAAAQEPHGSVDEATVVSAWRQAERAVLGASTGSVGPAERAAIAVVAAEARAHTEATAADFAATVLGWAQAVKRKAPNARLAWFGDRLVGVLRDRRVDGGHGSPQGPRRAVHAAPRPLVPAAPPEGTVAFLAGMALTLPGHAGLPVRRPALAQAA